MPVTAFRLAEIDRAYANSPKAVFSTSNRFKVSWIDAITSAAQMVNGESPRYLANEQLICDSVCPYIRFAYTHIPVPC